MADKDTSQVDDKGQNQDTSDDSQDSTGQDQGALNEDKDNGDGVKFNKAQMQQIGSYMGRLIKEHIDKNVVPLIEQNKNSTGTHIDNLNREGENQSAIDKFNSQLQELILQGNVVEALQKFSQLHELMNKNKSNELTKQTDNALAKLSDKPYYKDIYPKVEKEAKSLVKKGYPPEAAVEYAYQSARADHLETLMGGGGKDTDTGLDMETGGRRGKDKTSTTKLPEPFEAAYQRDKKAGLFKDRNEFKAALNASIKEQYGIR